MPPVTAPPAYAFPAGEIPIGFSARGGWVIFVNLQSGANAVFTPNVGTDATLTPTLAPGTNSVTAHYSGDANYAGSVSNTIDVTIPASATTVTLTSSASTIYAAQSVTFTATLSNAGATGTVTFMDAYPGPDPLQPVLSPSATVLGTAPVANGVATLTTTQLAAGIHTITAVYGDVNNPSATAQLTENVNLPFGMNNSGSGISLTVTSVKSVSTELSISALGGLAGPVTLACRDFDGTCSFSPAMVDLAGTGATTVTLTVTATRAATTAQISPRFSDTILLCGIPACGIPLFALFGIASTGRSRTLFAVIALAFCGISCLGCGGSGGQQASSSSSASSASLPAGAYPFYVTATSGQNELAMNAVLTVQ
jgi:hypothetical protein